MLAGFEVTRTDDIPQQPVAEGIALTMLREGTGNSDLSAMVIEFAPGAEFGMETHEKPEVLYVLEGEFHDGEAAHPAGTLITAKEGSVHWPASKTGCRVLVLYPNGATK